MGRPSQLGLPLLVACAALVAVPGATQRDDAAPAGAVPPSVSFADVTRLTGIELQHVNGASPQKFLVETMGSGGLFFDYDNDGWLDVFLVDGGAWADPQVAGSASHRLFRNRGDGTFDDASDSSGIRHREYGMGACAADFDNDGLTDLYVTNAGPNALYRNTGAGTFVDVTELAGVGLALWSTSCAFLDVDRDGDVDLFVTNYVNASQAVHPFCGDPARQLRVYCHPLNYEPLSSVLYRNDGDGRFRDVSLESGVGGHRGNGLGVVVGDYDNDGWPDVFVANDAMPDFLFHNEADGTFREVGLLAGVSVAASGKSQAGMGTDFGDYDDDGRLDLIVTNHEFETNSLLRNLGDGLFAESSTPSGVGPPSLPYVGFGVAFLDYDNDTHLDIAIANGHVIDNTSRFRAGSMYAQPNLLLRNAGDGQFTDVTALAGSGFSAAHVSRTLAVGDIDNDGDLDLLITNNGQSPALLRNEGGNRNNALLVKLIGRASNRDGIGAKLRVAVGGRTLFREVKAGSSYLGQNDLRAHFGLGDATVVDQLEIQWPSGGRDMVSDVPTNHIVTVVEGQGETGRERFQASR